MRPTNYVVRKLSNNEFTDHVMIKDLITLLKLKIGTSYKTGCFHWEMNRNTYTSLICNDCVRKNINFGKLYGYDINIVNIRKDDEIRFVYNSNKGEYMKEGDITFVNVVVDLIKCYCNDNDADPELIFDAISTAFKKEDKNVDRYQA